MNEAIYRHGHTVPRTALHHLEMGVIELVSGKVKNRISTENVVSIELHRQVM